MSTTDYWTNWEPNARILAGLRGDEPTKPSQPRSVGFDGALKPNEQAIARAMRLLNLAGCRVIRHDGDLLIGLWEDLDCLELRAAIRTVGIHGHRVVHLESGQVDIRYKVRHCLEGSSSESFSSWLERAEAALPSGSRLWPSIGAKHIAA